MVWKLVQVGVLLHRHLGLPVDQDLVQLFRRFDGQKAGIGAREKCVILVAQGIVIESVHFDDIWTL
jgi:hypothetical protein